MSSINIFKRSVIGLVVLGFASISHAAAFSGVFIGAEGLDLQPRNGDLDFVTVFPVVDGVDAFNVYNIDTSYHWGWRVYGGIKFCGDEDITLSWMRWHDNDVETIADPEGAAQTRWVNPSLYSSISGSVNFNVDEAYGVFGHTFKTPAWSFRFAGGVEWARIRSTLGSSAFCEFCDVDVGFNSYNTTRGWGPRAEMDIAYTVPFGVSLFAKTNAALLVGSRDISLDSVEVDSDFYQSVYFSNRHVIIPKVGMKVGVGYTYVVGGAGGEGAAPMGYAISVYAGWQVDSYIHAIERPVGAFSEAGNTETKVSNLGLQGLFVGVKLGADWM